MGLVSASRLHEAIVAAGVAITGLRIGVEGQSATVFVDPLNLQAAAQATINAFDWSQAAEDLYLDRAKSVQQGRAVRLAANTTPNSTVTLADVGLSFNVPANSHFLFRFVGAYTSALSTTGLSLAVNGPASPVLVRMVANIAMTATTAQNGAVAAYNTPVSAGTSAAATPLPFWVEGNLSTGPTPGVFALRFASEVAGSAVTILSGSFGQLTPVG